ncbi:unnamed protein product [Prorocentrum cordatum]|uniref:Uncharacterized protein n=1 Tax=Prorocentrum cordatum TaxID=2364126 RepID=A0ABN9T4A1_9DINO|nr:unnamed protein product [Polarella glacialis]
MGSSSGTMPSARKTVNIRNVASGRLPAWGHVGPHAYDQGVRHRVEFVLGELAMLLAHTGREKGRVRLDLIHLPHALCFAVVLQRCTATLRAIRGRGVEAAREKLDSRRQEVQERQLLEQKAEPLSTVLWANLLLDLRAALRPAGPRLGCDPCFKRGTSARGRKCGVSAATGGLLGGSGLKRVQPLQLPAEHVELAQVQSITYLYIVGPEADSAAADAHCGGDLSALDAAQAACSEDPGCTMLLAAGCDDEAWRTCTSQPFLVYSAGPGTDACTMLKAEEVTDTSSTTSVSLVASDTTTTATFTAGIYVGGPSVGSDTFEGRCHGAWSTREHAQAACDADAGCFFLFSWDCQPWAWLPCGGLDDLSAMVAEAAAETEDAASCTEVSISLVTSSDTSTRTLTTRTATQTSSSMTTQTSTRTATQTILR